MMVPCKANWRLRIRQGRRGGWEWRVERDGHAYGGEDGFGLVARGHRRTRRGAVKDGQKALAQERHDYETRRFAWEDVAA